jgi:hypothetical protein
MQPAAQDRDHADRPDRGEQGVLGAEEQDGNGTGDPNECTDEAEGRGARSRNLGRDRHGNPRQKCDGSRDLAD